MSWRQLARLFARDLVRLAILMALFAGLYALAQLAVHGRVIW